MSSFDVLESHCAALGTCLCLLSQEAEGKEIAVEVDVCFDRKRTGKGLLRRRKKGSRGSLQQRRGGKRNCRLWVSSTSMKATRSVCVTNDMLLACPCEFPAQDFFVVSVCLLTRSAV